MPRNVPEGELPHRIVNISASIVREIHIWDRAGNDKIVCTFNAPALLYGGEGNDELRGPDASSLLFGGAGSDKLYDGCGDACSSEATCPTNSPTNCCAR